MKVELLVQRMPFYGPQRLVFRISETDGSIGSISVSIMRVGELRDDWILGTQIEIIDGIAECNLPDPFPAGVYQVAEVRPQGRVPSGAEISLMIGAPRERRSDLYFVIDDGTLNAGDPASLASEVYLKRHERAIAPLRTPMVEQGVPRRFLIVAFYAGVRLDHEQQLKGCVVKPLSLGLGLSALDEVISRHLAETLGLDMRFGALADEDFRNANRLFAIHIENLWGLGMADSLPFATEYADNIAALIGVERGDMPKRCAVFFAILKGQASIQSLKRIVGILFRPCSGMNKPI
ncbi:MAG: hypothetical protein HZA66_01560 [Rhodopseudomonas palustris]|uniref:Uncharacterized protein n=1 Tax=Rhodopseudomonas palustris TaxID=1076 RepID=A0A933VSY2_RHOPL|nr:hypothetical protein [Rhodopseudomonas palustris]